MLRGPFHRLWCAITPDHFCGKGCGWACVLMWKWAYLYKNSKKNVMHWTIERICTGEELVSCFAKIVRMLRPPLQIAFPLSMVSLKQRQCGSLGIEHVVHSLRKFDHIPSPNWQFPAEPSSFCLSLRQEPAMHKSRLIRLNKILLLLKIRSYDCCCVLR